MEYTMFYKIRKCSEPGKKGGGKIQYRATIDLKKTLTLRDFAIWSEKKGTLTESDIMAATYDMLTFIEINCAIGHPVDFGDLGKYYPSMFSKAVDSPKKVTPKTIKHVKFRYRISKRLKEATKLIRFKKAKKIISY